MGCGASAGTSDTADDAEPEPQESKDDAGGKHYYDLPRRSAPDHWTSHEGGDDDGRTGSTLPPPPPPPESWEWQEGPDSWREFEPEIARKFIVAKRLGMKKFVYCYGGKAYRADLEKREQINKMTGYTRKIRLVKEASVPPAGRSAADRARASAAFDAYARTGGRGRRDARAQFQWQLKNGDWVDYEDEEGDNITQAWAAGKSSFQYQARGHDYEIDFDDMVQVNLGTSQARTIRVVEKRHSSKPGRPVPATNFPEPEAPPFAPPPPSRPERDPFRTPSAAAEREGERAASGPADGRRFKAFRIPPKAKEDPGPRPRVTTSQPPPPPPKGPGAKRPHASHEDPGPRRKAADTAGGLPGRARAATEHRGTAAKTKQPLPEGVFLPEAERPRKEAEALFEELCAVSKEPMSERKKAFKAACMRWHPDKNPDDEDMATDVFQFLQALKTWLFC